MLQLDIKKSNGIFYTKPIIVNMMLNLIGYTCNKNLYNYSLLDPSFGDGAFVIGAIERVIKSYKSTYGENAFKNEKKALNELKNSIRGIEISENNFEDGKQKIISTLVHLGASNKLANQLLEKWLVKTDFLFWENQEGIRFDFIVGNPPYIRIENIPVNTIKRYRSMFSTMSDRADIYVPFIQKGLDLLSKQGQLTYICTDRFSKNKYGQKLREYIGEKHQMRYFLDIHKTNPFHDEVSAYPCVFVIEQKRREPLPIRTLKMDIIDELHVHAAENYLLNGIESDMEQIKTYTLQNWFMGKEPWILDGQEAANLLKKLETGRKPLIDEVHQVKVGIGVASGANKVYIVHPDNVDIEQDVLIPLVTKDDIKTGQLNWRGYYIINPYNEDKSLINLNKYPKLKSYLMQHEETIKNRRIAKDNPDRWYKTIDPIHVNIINLPKLLIPDIKKESFIIKDKGGYYPEHSLYYILPGNWDIDILQAILTSSISKFFIWSYSPKMRGDYLRFQAQYLKKICLPSPESISSSIAVKLKKAMQQNDKSKVDELVADLYKLTKFELDTIQDLVK
ncbi:Eco57I restriction-modification methylase domain-containing protein [Priestia megaterium]|nr:Eco57I restriction-modification methylase domain-containing protein [Priestia megaterium]MCT9852292.1 Eco57I restriction-modification methylase domain-containing protein [Priestia megaterium]MDF1963046.1 Eco57I restriction-modification methylase domain-containing protein [Priestia megaterium]